MNANKRTFEDVQRQNAQVLRRLNSIPSLNRTVTINTKNFLNRTNSDATQNRYDVIRPRIREVTSAGDRGYCRVKQGFPATQPKKSSEERLKGSYTPANEVETKQDNGLSNTKHPGHIYVNHRLSGSLLTGDAVLTSYFAPGRPVTSSKMRNQRIDSRNPPWVTRPSTQPAPHSGSPNRNGITLATLPITPPKSPKKLSASSSPGVSGDESLKKIEKKADKSDVKVLAFGSGRPHTAYEEVPTQTYDNPNPRHPAFRGSNKSLNRGWRSWTKKSFENRINCVAQIYQSPMVNKKAAAAGISNKTNKAKLASLEKPAKVTEKTSSGRRSGKAKSHGMNNIDINDDVGKKERSSNFQHEYVTRISYSLTDGNKITTSRISDEPESVEGLPETNVPKTEHQMEKTQTNVLHQSSSNNEKENDVTTRYVCDSRNGIYFTEYKFYRGTSSSKNQNKTISSPWVDEAFNSIWAESEGYYVRKPKLNKTVTFSLNQKVNDDQVTSQNVMKSRDSKPSSMTAQPRRRIELLPYNHVTLSNGKAKIPLDPLRNSGNTRSFENKKNAYARINTQNHWPESSVGQLRFGNGIRFSTGTVNSVTT